MFEDWHLNHGTDYKALRVAYTYMQEKRGIVFLNRNPNKPRVGQDALNRNPNRERIGTPAVGQRPQGSTATLTGSAGSLQKNRQKANRIANAANRAGGNVSVGKITGGQGVSDF